MTSLRGRGSHVALCYWVGLLVIMAVGCPIAVSAADDQPVVPTLRVATTDDGGALFASILKHVELQGPIGVALKVEQVKATKALHDFCLNSSETAPDIIVTTHAVHGALAAECASGHGGTFVGVQLGHGAVVLASRQGSDVTSLTSHQIYLAVAREVPFRDDFVRNTSVRWSDVDSALPNQEIRFQMPLRDEANRELFDNLAMEGGCRSEPDVKQIVSAQARSARCVAARTARVREIPTPQAQRALLDAPVGTVGVLSNIGLAVHGGDLVLLAINGVHPTVDTIQNGDYDYSYAYWLYTKRDIVDREGEAEINAAVSRIVDWVQSDAIAVPGGPLSELDLVPLSAAARAAQRARLEAENAPYSVWSTLDDVASLTDQFWSMLAYGWNHPNPVTTPDEVDFTRLMDIAGYQIVSLNSTVGLIPEASMSFGLAREMSDSDVDFLERTLRRDAVQRRSGLSALQRTIIRGIVDRREVGGFEVSRVDVNFLPLPGVALTLSPKGTAYPAGPATPNGPSNNAEIGEAQ